MNYLKISCIMICLAGCTTKMIEGKKVYSLTDETKFQTIQLEKYEIYKKEINLKVALLLELIQKRDKLVKTVRLMNPKIKIDHEYLKESALSSLLTEARNEVFVLRKQIGELNKIIYETKGSEKAKK